MASSKKCPVCGGEMVSKEIEKILRGGQLTEIVKAQAEVCLRCGERLYAPDVVKRFEKIRSKLKKMAASPNTARGRLLAKLAYEIWFLDFLEKRCDMVTGEQDNPVLKIKNGEPGSIERVLEEYVGLDPKLINDRMPLTFIASFKTLDMIFEWIFEENQIMGKTSEVPRGFAKKVKMLTNTSNLQLPDLFTHQPYLYHYSKAIFCHLLPYRNEIIHNNRFSVSKETLTFSNSKKGTTLTLYNKQVNDLVRFVRALVRALASETAIDAYTDKILRHHLDSLAPIHGLATFNQPMPRFVYVELTVPRQGPAFPADMKDVREKIKSSPDQEIVFDLTVRATEGDHLIAKWYFAAEEVPDTDVMTFYEESHKTHRVALMEPKTIEV